MPRSSRGRSRVAIGPSRVGLSVLRRQTPILFGDLRPFYRSHPPSSANSAPGIGKLTHQSTLRVALIADAL